MNIINDTVYNDDGTIDIDKKDNTNIYMPYQLLEKCDKQKIPITLEKNIDTILFNV